MPKQLYLRALRPRALLRQGRLPADLAAHSIPLMFGRWMSISTTSGRREGICAMPSSALPTAQSQRPPVERHPQPQFRRA